MASWSWMCSPLQSNGGKNHYKGQRSKINILQDAATAEISRTQLWQWLRHDAKLEGKRREGTNEWMRTIGTLYVWMVNWGKRGKIFPLSQSREGSGKETLNCLYSLVRLWKEMRIDHCHPKGITIAMVDTHNMNKRDPTKEGSKLINCRWKNCWCSTGETDYCSWDREKTHQVPSPLSSPWFLPFQSWISRLSSSWGRRSTREIRYRRQIIRFPHYGCIR